jgi:hypothetical protein
MKFFMLRYWPHVLYPFYRNGFPNIGFLTMTGTEAMFADLCHFSVRSIQVNCVFLLFCLVPPSCLQFRNNLIHLSCPILEVVCNRDLIQYFVSNLEVVFNVVIGFWYIWHVFGDCTAWFHHFCIPFSVDGLHRTGTTTLQAITHPYQFCLIHLWLQIHKTPKSQLSIWIIIMEFHMWNSFHCEFF